MSMVPRVAGHVVDPTQQIAQMAGAISQIIVAQGQDARAALDVVDAANQKKIEALKAQVAAMEKTVAASQKALAESKARCVEKPKLLEANRKSNKVEYDALHAEYLQHVRRLEQCEPLFKELDKKINVEVLKIDAGLRFARLDNWSPYNDPREPWKDPRGPVGYALDRHETYLDGKRFVETYGGAVFKKKMNDLFKKNKSPAPLPFPGF